MPVQTFTTTAFVARGGYSPATRKHPALAYVEESDAWFDSGDPSIASNLSEWITEDFSYHTPHGEKIASTGGTDGQGINDAHAFFAATQKFYGGPMKAFKHRPEELIAIDAEHGYDLFYLGVLYADIEGEHSGAHREGEKVRDPEDGRVWDILIPVFYKFELARDESVRLGLKTRHMQIFKDTGMVNAALEKRDCGHLRTVK